MKGTIDVQIKHKDGSIETRHEHNVVFDLPAEITKKIIQTPVRGLNDWEYPKLGVAEIAGTVFPGFSLCEDSADLTRPKYLPCSLTTTRSSSSKWFTPAVTITTNDKNITAQASWTLGEAMTIKSIRVMGNYNPDERRPQRFFQVLADDSTLYMVGHSSGYAKKLSAADFKFTNPNTFFRLVPSTEIGSSDGSYLKTPLYYSYSLVNDERFVILNTNNSIVELSSGTACASVYNAAGTIRIFNSSTAGMTREFPLSQFSDFPTTQQYVWVVNTGTKNILLCRSYSSPYSIKSWQIPDTPTQDTIPTVDITFPDGFSTPTAVLDNYILYGASNSSSVIRLNDDLSVTTYKGRLNKNLSRSNDSYYSPMGYMPTGITFWATSNAVLYPNLTAANFSTPISLAEGDVLTVSYKIEVA